MENTIRSHFYHGPMIMKRRLYGIQAADGESAQQSCGCISACLIPYSARVACSLLIFVHVVGRAPPEGLSDYSFGKKRDRKKHVSLAHIKSACGIGFTREEAYRSSGEIPRGQFPRFSFYRFDPPNAEFKNSARRQKSTN